MSTLLYIQPFYCDCPRKTQHHDYDHHYHHHHHHRHHHPSWERDFNLSSRRFTTSNVASMSLLSLTSINHKRRDVCSSSWLLFADSLLGPAGVSPLRGSQTKLHSHTAPLQSQQAPDPAVKLYKVKGCENKQRYDILHSD